MSYVVGQCDVSCYHGTCTGRNECTCHDGWNGTKCNEGDSHANMEIVPIADLGDILKVMHVWGLWHGECYI